MPLLRSCRTDGFGMLVFLKKSCKTTFALRRALLRLLQIFQHFFCMSFRFHLFENVFDLAVGADDERGARDRKSTRLNSSHTVISYAVFCLKKKKKQKTSQVRFRIEKYLFLTVIVFGRYGRFLR